MHAEEFIRHLALERRYSAHTTKAYTRDLAQFELYLEVCYEVMQASEAKQTYIRSWLVSLMDQGLSSTTIARKLSTVKSFYNYLQREGVIANNPAHSLQAPKAPQRLPNFVDQQGMQNLFDSEDIYPEGFSGLRDRLMLTFLYEMGIRVAELMSIKDTDIDISRKQIRIIGKRNKERLIPFGEQLLQYWKGYQKVRSQEFNVLTEVSAFVTDKGQKLYPKFVYRKVNYYLGQVSTLEKRSPHVLRHTFATHMLNNGADLNAIKTLLGHSSLAATQVYTHNSIDQLKNIHKHAHPRG